MYQTVEGVICFYIFICAALLIFNLLYITRSKRIKRNEARRERRWENELLTEFIKPPQTRTENQSHRAILLRRLRRTEELMAFSEVLNHWLEGRREEIQSYFFTNQKIFRELAFHYGQKSAMERAFFAYVVATFHPPIGGARDMLLEILLGYMENSTVYCRENVLAALYALGNEQAVEHAFVLLCEHGWYHNPKLLSDGMAKFTGDKASLARRLWRGRKRWTEFLLVAIVQFAAGLRDDGLSGPFLDALEREMPPIEVRFALIRYFQRHADARAKSALLRIVEETQSGEESQLAIAAAGALSSYPGADTRRALKAALHSRNWYVRHNAALSLNALGVTLDELDEIRAGGDRYAIEMLEYVSGRGGADWKQAAVEMEKAVVEV